MDFLKRHKCDRIQGIVSRPLPLEELLGRYGRLAPTGRQVIPLRTL